LIESVGEGETILFVGAGVSQNLGLPGFSRLIELMGEDLGYDADIFSMHGDFMTLAEFYEDEARGLGRLRSKLDQEWHDPRIDLGASAIHRHIVELDLPLIYTTNWDAWLERSFERVEKEYVRVANVSDLRRAREGVTQIVKYHGDFQEDLTSLVLTEASYLDRLAFDSPLDIKLRADSLARPILFVGYSLGDINTRYLLHRLERVWRESGRPDARPVSYLALYRPNPIQDRVLKRRGVSTLQIDGLNPGDALLAFFEELLAEARGVRLSGSW
jgi:hypothetical protein